MNKINLTIYTAEEILDFIITNRETNLSRKEFRELKYKKIKPVGNLYLKDTNYSLYETKFDTIGVDSSKSLYTAYEDKYKSKYPQRRVKTIRDLKNFIKDIAEEEGNDNLYKRAKDYAFELSRKYTFEIESETMFIYKDSEFKPKGSD